jgi:hypothetical protein
VDVKRKRINNGRLQKRTVVQSGWKDDEHIGKYKEMQEVMFIHFLHFVFRIIPS